MHIKRQTLRILLAVGIITMLASSGIAGERQPIMHMNKKADLDGDGIIENVYFTCFNCFKPSGFGGYNTFVLRVRGNIAVFSGDNLNGHFEFGDIDTNDCYLEVLVPEEGPSDDHRVHFIRYTSGRIFKLGDLPGSLGDMSWPIKKDGIIITRVRGDVLDTWWYEGEFKYDPSIKDFRELTKNTYEINREVVLKHRLPLFKEPHSDLVVLTAEVGDRGIITLTDNKNWCCFKNESGESGWFPIILSYIPHIQLYAHDVFEGLRLAD